MPNPQQSKATSTAQDGQTSQLFHLAYVSTETAPFSPDSLIALLTEAREENARNDVTGLLLHREGSFYQVLEGDPRAVRSTFEVIEQDPRHKEVRILFSGQTEAREFADWQMGFINLDGVAIDELKGFSNFLTRDAQPQEFLENLSRGKRLAMMFMSML